MHSTTGRMLIIFPTLRMASLSIVAILTSVSSAQPAFVHKLVPNDSPSPRDYEFGVSVALDGDLALVGARVTSASGLTGTGAAYVFSASTGQQLMKLTATDVMQDDDFGYSVALNGNLALVGARFSNVTKGAAYLFNATTGQQLHKFVRSDSSGYSNFGDSVALSDPIALIASPVTDGAAYVFNANTGQQLLRIPAPPDAHKASFGQSVALFGNKALVTASNSSERAAAYVFDVTTGALLKKLTIPLGNIVRDAVGFSGNNALFNDENGAAVLLDVTTGQQLFRLIPTDAEPSDNFGRAALALNGNLALVASELDDGVHSASGSAYLFDVTTGEQLARITSPDDAPGSRFARSIALNGNQTLIGGSWIDQAGRNRGAAYLYQIDAGIPGDFDSDGDVDGRDFLVWQRNPNIGNLADWQASYGAGSLMVTNVAVPESASAVMMVSALTSFALRRKCRMIVNPQKIDRLSNKRSIR